ncbi:MAG: ABC transporter permease [Halobacteriales archaeon]
MQYRGRIAEALPTVASIAVAILVLFPLYWVVRRALDVEGATEILLRSENLRIFGNTVILVVVVTVASILISVPLAYVTTFTDIPFRRALTVLIALPLVVPSYIGAFGFVTAFGPRGELQSVLEPYGVESLPQIYGLPGATLVITLYTYPYVFITTRAALRSVNPSVVEAARTLNTKRGSVFRRVVLPQVKPAVGAGSLLVALYALSDFGTPAIMRFDVYTRVIYVNYNTWSPDSAALLSLQLVALAGVVLVAETALRGRTETRGSGVSGDGAAVIELGRWRAPAVAGSLVPPVLALAVPVGILFLWLVRGEASYASGGGFEFDVIYNSVYVAGLAAVAAAVAALPIAYTSASGGVVGRFTEKTVYFGYALPGVVLGLALVFFGSPTRLYQTVPLLVFGYVVRFLPESVGITRASFVQFDERLAEASRTLGGSPRKTFVRVMLPLVTPGIVAGAALVFLTTMKELPITLFLRPAGFSTLVTEVWSAYDEGFFGQATVPALVLVGISALSMLVILSMEKYEVG